MPRLRADCETGGAWSASQAQAEDDHASQLRRGGAIALNDLTLTSKLRRRARCRLNNYLTSIECESSIRAGDSDKEIAMRRFYLILGVAVCFLYSSFSAGQTRSEIFANNFTRQSPIPAGCLWVLPSFLGAPESGLYFDEPVEIRDGTSTGSFQIRVWRIGCHEPNRSAIAINFEHLSGSSFVDYPATYLTDSEGSEAPAGMFAQVPWGRSKIYNFTLYEENILFVDGPVYVLDTAETPSFYNGDLSLSLEWPSGQSLQIPVPSYNPRFDPRPFDTAPLHGRYSGQWVVDGLPSTGLVLQVGEIAPDRNFVFAIWFTYVDGNPTWFAGNADIENGNHEVTLDMAQLEGGDVITKPGSFAQEDITADIVGTMTLRTVHCNAMEADIDFTDSGLGQEFLELTRLVRIAGYDCDQTQ